MHRFNALTFTYVRVVCAQLPPRLHFPTPPTPPTALSHASSPPPSWAPSVLIGVGVCRSTCLQIMFIHVYKPLTCTGRRTWLSSTGNWQLGTGKLSHGHGVLLGLGLGLRLGLVVVLVLRTGVSPGINVSVINASTALWHFGFLGG